MITSNIFNGVSHIRTFARLLSVVPFLGMLGGVAFANRVTPLLFGLPFVLAWIVLWVVLTSLIMAIVFAIDPANRGHETEHLPGKPR